MRKLHYWHHSQSEWRACAYITKSATLPYHWNGNTKLVFTMAQNTKNGWNPRKPIYRTSGCPVIPDVRAWRSNFQTHLTLYRASDQKLSLRPENEFFLKNWRSRFGPMSFAAMGEKKKKITMGSHTTTWKKLSQKRVSPYKGCLAYLMLHACPVLKKLSFRVMDMCVNKLFDTIKTIIVVNIPVLLWQLLSWVARKLYRYA